MQSLEGWDPKTKLTGASQVTLTEAEVRGLRRDMQEQENLIQGYQVPAHAQTFARPQPLITTMLHVVIIAQQACCSHPVVARQSMQKRAIVITAWRSELGSGHT